MITILDAELDRSIAHVRQAVPEEACGLLAAPRWAPDHVEVALPMLNVADHPEVRYQIDPARHMEAVALLDTRNLRVVGIYHSHVGYGVQLSGHDLRYALDPSKVHLVIGYDPRTGDVDWALWQVRDGVAVPVELLIG